MFRLWPTRMTNVMHYIFVLGLCLGSLPHAVRAEAMAVRATGQAIATGAPSDARLEQRALQDALYQAALQGGAQVSGYSAISQSVMRSDVLVVRPDSKILGYTVLNRNTTTQKSTVTINASVGNLSAPVVCGRRAELDIALAPPRVETSWQSPAWLENLEPHISAGAQKALAAKPGISVSATARAAAQTSNPSFDYATLTRGTAPETKRSPATASLESFVTIKAPERRNMAEILPVSISVSLDRHHIGKSALSKVVQKEITLSKRTPFASLNASSIKSRQTVIEDIVQTVTELSQIIADERACEPLTARLTLKGEQLTLPFGRRDGLTKHHLAYTKGRDTPYELLEIITLNPNSVSLRPLDSSMRPRDLSGKTVQFMELSK